MRLDSAHDAIETRVLLGNSDKVSYICKWNPRGEDTSEHCRRAFAEGKVTEARKGKRIALLTTRKRQEYKGKKYAFTRIMQVTERTIDKHGQVLLVPEVTVDGWWTNLELPEQKIIDLYKNHGLSEQLHGEFKTDLGLERLPSGKFATNALVMPLAVFAYNILRFIGQLGLLGEKSPVQHPTKRRRIKTVIQELMYLAARLILSGNRTISCDPLQSKCRGVVRLFDAIFV